MPRRLYFILLLFTIWFSTPASAQSNYTITDFFVPNGDIRLQVRKITETTYSSRRKIPLLLIHGETGATTSFDLDVPDASFAKALSLSGFNVYLMNIRGFERSTAPAYNVADTALVAGSCVEAASDIDAVVNYILRDNPSGKINLFGWATGGHWASYYTSLHNSRVANLVVLNSLYGVKAPWAFNQAFADPRDSAQFNNSIPAYSKLSEQQLAERWQNDTASTDTLQIDFDLVKTYTKSAVGFNNEHLLKVPGGFRKEAFYMAGGRKYWDAKDITVPTLVIRSEKDDWSRAVDLDTYYDDLKNAPLRKKLVIPHANHFVFLDYKSNSRRKLLIAINNFIKKGL